MFAKITLLIAALSIGSTLAAKEPPVQRRVQEVVSYGDLNLASDDGVAVLKRRMHVAVNQACQVEEQESVDLLELMREKKCVARALAAADQRVSEVTAVARRATATHSEVAAR